jgi:hypothetical protein
MIDHPKKVENGQREESRLKCKAFYAIFLYLPQGRK